MSACKVLIVDDHPVFRHGLRRVVESDRRFTIVGEAGDAPSARSLLATTPVDVLTVDLAMPRGSGLDLLSAVRVEHPSVRVLVLTMCDEALYGMRAFRAGALGYLGKGASAETLIDAIDAVSRGQCVASAPLREQVLQQAFHGLGAGDPVAGLSDRELEVLRLLSLGTDTAGIADTLGLSVKTVESHRGNIARKLGVRGTAGLVRAAVAALGPASGLDGARTVRQSGAVGT